MLVIKDFATTTTASVLTAEATSITVVDGSKFPSLAAGDYFYAVIQDFYDRRGVEVVKVLGVSGNELSVERGLDGTVGRAFSAGAYVELRLTVRTFAEFIAQSGGRGRLTISTGAPTGIPLENEEWVMIGNVG